MYQFYLDTMKKCEVGNLHSISLVELKNYLIQLDKEYGEGKITELTDEEYDKLHQIYIELSGKVIRGGMTSKVKVEHDYLNLKGTIKKVHYISNKEKESDSNAISAHKVLGDWITETHARLKGGRTHPIGFFPKYDGISIILSIDENGKVTKAITRGEENLGVDKTHIFDSIDMSKVIPEDLRGKKIGLKTECIMRKDKFKDYNAKFGNNELVNPRTAITSLINSDIFTDIHKEYLSIVPLMLDVDGEQVPYVFDEFSPTVVIAESILKKDFDTMLESIITMVKSGIEKLPYECDGIVVRWLNKDDIVNLGRDNSNFVNKFEIAYKFPMANNYTKLRGIVQDIGLLGKVSFTAKVEPIKINGKVITSVSLGSEERMKSLKLHIGDTVNIKYEIVPYLIVDSYCEKRRVVGDAIPVITHCPYCCEELTRNPELGCYNHECPSRIQGKLYNFCIRMNIMGVGESLIESLYSSNLVTCIKDFFTLSKKRKEFVSISGIGEKMYNNMVSQIENLECTEEQILASLSIKGIGPKTAKMILSIYHLSELNKLTVSQLYSIDGIGYKTAEIIREGVAQNYDLIQFLLDSVKVVKSKKGKGNVCFTGFRNVVFKSFLESKGYEVSDSVSKKIDLVIAENPNSTSSKIVKAREYGIPVISSAQAYVDFKFNKK